MKKQFLFLFFFAFLFAASTQIQAQERIVKGTVKDYEGKALSGITVMIKGTTSASVTNGSGQYSIKAGTGSVLVFSKGKTLIKEEVNTGSNSMIDVTMYPNTRKGKRKRKRAMKKKK